MEQSSSYALSAGRPLAEVSDVKSETVESAEPNNVGAEALANEFSGMEIEEDIYVDQEDFLDVIHEKFLEIVNPIESQLVDDLRGCMVLSSDDEHEIRAPVTRRDQARELWVKLHRASPASFQNNCYPAIRNRYNHMLGRVSFCWDGQKDVGERCLRHVIMKRMKRRRFADMFPHTKGCSQEEYRKIIDGSDTDEGKWDLVFQLCAKNSQNTKLQQSMQKALENIGATIPQNFLSKLANGFPCTCQSRVPRMRKIRRKRQTNSRVNQDASVSSCGYASTLPDCDVDERYSVSISSRDSVVVPQAAGDGERDTQFMTTEQKGYVLQKINEINAAIVKTSGIKTLVRELTGIRDQLNILETPEKFEICTPQNFSEKDKVHELKLRAKDLNDKLWKDFEEVSRFQKEVERADLGFDFDLTFSLRKTLLGKRQLFINEMKEAIPFFETVAKEFSPSLQCIESSLPKGTEDSGVSNSEKLRDHVTKQRSEPGTRLAAASVSQSTGLNSSSEDALEEFRFLLLGKTGSGKSTTGNTILGKDLFQVSVSFASVTSECSLRRAKRNHSMIEIFDSPGLYDTSKTHDEVAAIVTQAFACMHPGPDAVFYVMRIGRYTEEEYAVYNRLKVIMDENVTRYMIILFTHGDFLKDGNYSIGELLKSAPQNLQKVLRDCNNRVVVIDNTNKSDSRQVEDLLNCARELKLANGGIPYHCPKYDIVGKKMEEILKESQDGRKGVAKGDPFFIQLVDAVMRVQREKSKQGSKTQAESYSLRLDKLKDEIAQAHYSRDRQCSVM